MQPDPLSPHTEFSAQVYLLRPDEAGRRTPIFDGYRPQLVLGTGAGPVEVTGEVHFRDGVELLVPGDTTEVNIVLSQRVAVVAGVQFVMLEGKRTVAAGTITRILE